MADSMRGQLESGQLSEKQKEQAKALLDRMEKLLVNDFYIRNTGDKIYETSFFWHWRIRRRPCSIL